VPGVTVRLTWRNYSDELASHEIDAVTDTQGHVAFSARTLTASLGHRVVAVVSSARTGVHASFGPHASVFAFSSELQGFDIDQEKDMVVNWTGKPEHMESRIIVVPRKSIDDISGAFKTEH
jgi:hypothetical protein